MRLDKKMLSALVITSACSAASHAVDMLGNPTTIGVPGKIDLQLGGGKTNLALDSAKSTGIWKIGTLSGTQSIPAFSGKLKQDQAVIGITYALNARTQLFGSLGIGKDSGQKSSSHGIGVKISPDMDASEMKMGLILGAQQVKTNIDGPLSVHGGFSDGTNNYSVGAFPLNGTEQIKYTRLDAFFGASRSAGVIRPYGGLCLTHISGTDTLAVDDTTTVWSYPIAGGPVTSSTQHVSFNAKSDISGSGYFTGVLGLSINPDGDIGMIAEIQGGLQRSFMMSGNIRF